MMDNLWPLLVMAIGVIVAIAQAFVKQGDVAIREQAVTVSAKELDLAEKHLAVELAKKTAERISVVEAANITFSTQLTAMTQEFSNVVKQYTLAKADLDRTIAEREVLQRRVAELETEVAQLKSENAAMRTELDALRGRVTVTEAKA